MIGGSYDGTTATATATQRPPHLTTIVPQAAISRLVRLRVLRRHPLHRTTTSSSAAGPGAVSDEGVDTPLGFDFGFAIPPPVDVDGPDWQQRVQSTITPCEEFEHTHNGYDDTPDYDVFWLERDYLVDAREDHDPGPRRAQLGRLERQAGGAASTSGAR